MSFTISALIILTCITGLNIISWHFISDIVITHQPVTVFVVLYAVSGLVYFCYVYRLKNYRPVIKNLVLWIFIVGTVGRILMIFSMPILEVDYYRYLWDGAVTASWNNPYKYSPQQFLDEIDNLPLTLVNLSANNKNILDKINHPELKTSYPPITQAFFAISNLIKPFSLTTWKFVLLFVDVVTFILIYLLLKKFKIPESNLIIYWWNPLVIKEVFNSAHMDIIVFPFVLGCFLLFLSKKYIFSFTALSAAIGAKLWPVLLFPVLIRKFTSDRNNLFKYLLVFSVLTVILLLPLLVSYFYQGSGIEAYSRSWQNNDSIFRIILAISEFILPIIGYHPGHGQFISRVAAGIIVVLTILFFIRYRAKDSLEYFKTGLIIISFTFFLSPAQFPWYYLWMLPFLIFIPYKPLLFLTVLMPLYYLRYYFEPRGEYEFYYRYIVWLEYLPVLGWIVYDLINKKLRAKSKA